MVDEQDKYWCDNEQWGIIDRNGKEIVPCKYDEISCIENTERFVLCYKNGCIEGNYVIYDIEQAIEIAKVNFEYDAGYMFNECIYKNKCICFYIHEFGEEKDIIYVYSLFEKKWIVNGKVYDCHLERENMLKRRDDEE